MCFWKTPKIKMPQTSARDLLPSTESQTPDSPVYGGSNDWKTKRRGAQALQIGRVNTNTNNYNSNNDYNAGGWRI